MTPSYVALHFVSLLFIFILQYLFYDQFQTEIRSALHNVVLNHQQLHHEFISDRIRFPVMSTDGKLVLDPFPTEPLDFGIWFETQSRKANEAPSKSKMRKTRQKLFLFLPFS